MFIVGDLLRKSFAPYPFASAKVMSHHFGMSPSMIKEVLSREFGFRKYA
jgi:hypothetical protein